MARGSWEWIRVWRGTRLTWWFRLWMGFWFAWSWTGLFEIVLILFPQISKELCAFLWDRFVTLERKHGMTADCEIATDKISILSRFWSETFCSRRIFRRFYLSHEAIYQKFVFLWLRSAWAWKPLSNLAILGKLQRVFRRSHDPPRTVTYSEYFVYVLTSKTVREAVPSMNTNKNSDGEENPLITSPQLLSSKYTCNWY